MKLLSNEEKTAIGGLVHNEAALTAFIKLLSDRRDKVNKGVSVAAVQAVFSDDKKDTLLLMGEQRGLDYVLNILKEITG